MTILAEFDVNRWPIFKHCVLFVSYIRGFYDFEKNSAYDFFLKALYTL